MLKSKKNPVAQCVRTQNTALLVDSSGLKSMAFASSVTGLGGIFAIFLAAYIRSVFIPGRCDTRFLSADQLGYLNFAIVHLSFGMFEGPIVTSRIRALTRSRPVWGQKTDETCHDPSEKQGRSSDLVQDLQDQIKGCKNILMVMMVAQACLAVTLGAGQNVYHDAQYDGPYIDNLVLHSLILLFALASTVSPLVGVARQLEDLLGEERLLPDGQYLKPNQF